MTNNQQAASNNKLSGLWMNVILLFSLFAFSGLSAQNQSQQQTTRTELPVSVRTNYKRTTSYKILSTPLYTICISSLKKDEFNKSLFLYARVVKTQLATHSKRVISFKKNVRIYKLKNHLLYSDEYPVHSSQG